MRRRAHVRVLLVSMGLVATAGVGASTLEASGGSADPARALLLDPDHAAWSVQAPELYRVRFQTTRGDFLLEVHREWAPLGADRVYNLARLGFYDDTRVYRVRAGFIAQFGLSGDPAVNAVWYGRTMADDPVRRSNTRGMVSFAMPEAPNTRTTQLFVNLADNARLDAQGFAPVGQVLEGMDVVDALYSGYDEGAGGGMRGGNQGRIVAEGNAHLDADFPLLDHIVRASIEPGRIQRYPNPGANRIRVEGHLLPAVTTGPLDPTWSPDGTELAFSMRGDIWSVAASGGAAQRLTQGPAYYFEPTWSPDGRYIACTSDLDGNLEISLVPVAGGEVVNLTRHPHIDVEPAWAADSTAVYFASARDGSFDIYRAGVDSPGEAEAVVTGRGHQIEPALSPDGNSLAFVSPMRGRLGAGGIWRLGLADRQLPASADTADLVHAEETSYRVEPGWSADSRNLLFVSDAAGSDDLAAIPAIGGSPARLTEDHGDEYTPAMSSDGTRIAFVSNRYGPMRLYTVAAGGGRRAAWHPVAVQPADEGWGTLRIRALSASGEPEPSRVSVIGSDGRAYAPADGFHRVASATDTHYFHTEGVAEVTVPAGLARVRVSRGFENQPAVARVEARAGETVEVSLTPQRLIDAPARGWYSGETHAHDLHQGRYGLDHGSFYRQLVAEDLHLTNALIHMDGTRIMGRWADLTGEPSPLSSPQHILQYAQEFRGSFGHVGLLGISDFVTPLIGGTGGTVFAPDVLNYLYLDAAVAQGGIGGFMHPYTRAIERPEDGAGSEIALDVALGKGVFYDAACIWYDELANAQMYYRYLNAGFRLAATGGSDNFADVWRDPPPGTARTYARVEGPLSVPGWLDAIRAGRTFATTGPLLLLTVNGAEPGAELQLGEGDAETVDVALDVASAAPLDRVEILVNGVVAAAIDARARPATFSLHRRVAVPDGGWVAARALGPSSPMVTDSYAFAQTTPVWIVRNGVPYVNPDDAHFLADMVRAQWQRVSQRDRFASSAARETYHRAVRQAIEIYESRAAVGER